jgi:phage shock protein PspC (stress-responsive transcriptional regulator)
LVHIAELDPNVVRLLWIALAGIGYCGLLFIAARKAERQYGLIDALAFAMLVLLEPFSQKYALVVLLWPAMVAARVVGRSKARGLLYVAIAVAFIQPLVNGAAAQRLEQVLGFDFLATALLAAFLVASIFEPSTERYSRD